MSEKTLKTPIALMIFNRPEKTEKIFAEIAKVKPSKLLVVADGPRLDKLCEREKCEETRAIISRVDWECEVLTNFSKVNLGCKKRISSGLDWIFENVEEAIILEDDCLPHPTFFTFCEELLDTYREDERIAMISGDNFQFGKKRTDNSYYFSRYAHIWGWATWRRSWKNYDVDMKLWPNIRDEGWLVDLLGDKKIASYWEKTFNKVYNNEIDTWDCQWVFSCWVTHSMIILPNVNLISNIGFGPEALHTKSKNKYSEMEVEPMQFPLTHPKYMIRDSNADNITQNTMFSSNFIKSKISALSKIWNNGELFKFRIQL